MLNRQVLEGNWNQIKGKVREKWGELTDDDLEAVRGKGDQLVGTIQRKTGEARERIEHFLDQTLGEGAALTSRTAESARRYAHQATERAGRVSDSVSRALGAGFDSAQNVIRDRPAQSMGIAFGLGMVAGMVVGLICHRR